MSSNPHIGSSLDDLLAEEAALIEINSIALKQIIAWQVKQAMVKKGLTKTAMAKAMNTSRAALDRLLDPENTSVTLSTLERAASVIGKRLSLDLVDVA